MSRERSIRLCVPGSLRYRPLAIRTVAEACRLVTARGQQRSERRRAGDLDLSNRFDAEMVSAFSELFNNIIIHGYGGQVIGDIEIVLWPHEEHLTVEISDTGTSFDVASVPAPALDTLPHGGMGIHIVRSFVDEVLYQPGPPNVWRITKYASRSGREAGEAADGSDPEVE